MGVKQSIVISIVLIMLSGCAVMAQEICPLGAQLILPLNGVTAPDNLYQFAYPCFFYLVNQSNIVIANNLRPAYEQTIFAAESPILTRTDYGGVCPSSGTVVVCICHYTENTGEISQRAWYAARAITIAQDCVIGDAVGFIEVPSAAVNNQGGGVVRVSWQAVPSNDAVIGYRVIRSADGLTNWVDVGDTTNTYLDDTPGAGQWYYAVEIKFAGTPTTYVSRHGLLASITLE